MDLWIKKLFRKKTPGTCLFRVDAGNRPGLSFGHLSRCLVLRDKMEKMFNTQTYFLMKEIKEGVEYARLNGVHVLTIPEKTDAHEDFELMEKFINKINPDTFIIDLPFYEPGEIFFAGLRSKNIQSVFIDDLRFFNPGADFVINSSVNAPDRFKKSEKEMFLGPDFLIFDDKLITGRQIFDDDKKNIVLSFGGADPSGLTENVVNTLCSLDIPEKYFFYIILGPGYAYKEKIERFILGKERNFIIVESPENIFPYFESADLVICAGGRTMYELTYLSKKFFPIASCQNESAVVKAFLERSLISSGLLSWEKKDFIDTLYLIFKENI